MTDKFETGPMAVGGMGECRREKQEEGEEPASKHQIQPESKIKRAVLGWDGRTCMTRPDSQA